MQILWIEKITPPEPETHGAFEKLEVSESGSLDAKRIENIRCEKLFEAGTTSLLTNPLHEKATVDTNFQGDTEEELNTNDVSINEAQVINKAFEYDASASNSVTQGRCSTDTSGSNMGYELWKGSNISASYYTTCAIGFPKGGISCWRS